MKKSILLSLLCLIAANGMAQFSTGDLSNFKNQATKVIDQIPANLNQNQLPKSLNSISQDINKLIKPSSTQNSQNSRGNPTSTPSQNSSPAVSPASSQNISDCVAR